MLSVGSLLDNKYKILSEVGHGGMSVVYLAINERANKTWAVKEIRKDGVIDFESVKQGLVVETNMLKKLKHPHLPSIIDVLDGEDSFIIVMDYIEGTSLLKLLQTEGAQPEEKVVKWGRQLCDVLAYLHRQQPPIIYRDMKPANIMLKPDGTITLIDFGIAREFKNRAMVEDTTCLGTRGYAAPEQFGGRGQTDPRTDIYCLGATLYHLLTGHSPAEPPYEIKPLRYWLPQYAGSGLEKLILKCTQQDPSARYQSCEELMYALQHYREEDDRIQRQRRSKWRRFLAGVLVGCLGLAGSIGFHLALDGAKKDSYEYLIQQAQSQGNLEGAKTYFKQALEVDAGDQEAYEALLELAEQDIVANEGELSSETASIINDCLNSTANGSQSYISQLQKENPSEYAKVMYEMGIWYFFMKGNTDGVKKQASDNYFSKIQEDRYLGCLKEGQQQMAELLYKIGGYIGSLNSNMSKYGADTDSKGSYKALFSDLSTIVTGNLKSRVEKDSYCIKIYEQTANWLDNNYSDFTGDGIQKEQIETLLETIRKGLEGLEIREGNNSYEDYRQALDTVNNALQLVNRASETAD